MIRDIIYSAVKWGPRNLIHRIALPARTPEVEVNFDTLERLGYCVTREMREWGSSSFPPVCLGCVLPAPGASGRATDEGIIIYCHGNSEVITDADFVAKMRCLANRTRRRVYVMEFCGYESAQHLKNMLYLNWNRARTLDPRARSGAGAADEASVEGQWLDESSLVHAARVCATYVMRHDFVPGETSVVACGYSIGSIGCVNCAPLLNAHPRCGVVLIAPVFSALNTQLPLWAIRREWDAMRLDDALRHVECPMHVSCGDNDTVVPLRNSHNVLRASGAPPHTKRLVVLQNVDHHDITSPAQLGAVVTEGIDFIESVRRSQDAV